MSDIIIYNENSQKMTEVGFVRNISEQTKLRDINNSYELSKQAGLVFAVALNHLGIKEALPQITKQDIMEMLLTRYKNLSLDEVAYAFKLERYGVLGDRTEHFQLFNAQYVSDVLEKYKTWKMEVKKLHNISVVIEEKSDISDEEKRYWINKGVTECLDEFEKTSLIKEGSFNTYNILFDLGYLPKDKQYKETILESAIECIKIEQDLLKDVKGSDPRKISETLERIKNPKDSIVIIKCKELVLSQFFRNLLKDQERLNKFRETFKVIKPNGTEI